MKIEAIKIETQNCGRLIGQVLAEPFLAIGMIVFWATALPAAAIFFGVVRAAEQIRAYVPAPTTAGVRLVRHAA